MWWKWLVFLPWSDTRSEVLGFHSRILLTLSESKCGTLCKWHLRSYIILCSFWHVRSMCYKRLALSSGLGASPHLALSSIPAMNPPLQARLSSLLDTLHSSDNRHIDWQLHQVVKFLGAAQAQDSTRNYYNQQRALWTDWLPTNPCMTLSSGLPSCSYSSWGQSAIDCNAPVCDSSTYWTLSEFWCINTRIDHVQLAGVGWFLGLEPAILFQTQTNSARVFFI